MLEQLAHPRRGAGARGTGGSASARRRRPTVSRGLSDPYGSWKTICTLRRKAAARAGGSAGSSSPSKPMRPRSGSISSQDQPPGGGLAAARLAHQPERLPAPDVEADAVDGAHRARAAADAPETASGPGSASPGPRPRAAGGGAARRLRAGQARPGGPAQLNGGTSPPRTPARRPDSAEGRGTRRAARVGPGLSPAWAAAGRRLELGQARR